MKWLLLSLAGLGLQSGVCSGPVKSRECRDGDYWEEAMERCVPCQNICSVPSPDDPVQDSCLRLCPDFIRSTTPTSTAKQFTSVSPTHNSGTDSGKGITPLIVAPVVTGAIVFIMVLLVCVCIRGHKKMRARGCCYGHSDIQNKEPDTFPRKNSTTSPLVVEVNGQQSDHHTTLVNTQHTPTTDEKTNYQTDKYVSISDTNPDMEYENISVTNEQPSLSLSLLSGDSEVREHDSNIEPVIFRGGESCRFVRDVVAENPAASIIHTYPTPHRGATEENSAAVSLRSNSSPHSPVMLSNIDRGPPSVNIPRHPASAATTSHAHLPPNSHAVSPHIEREPLSGNIPQHPASAQQLHQPAALPASVGTHQDSGIGPAGSYFTGYDRPSFGDDGQNWMDSMGTTLSTLSVASNAVSLPLPDVLDEARRWMQECLWIWGCARGRNNVHDIYVLDVSVGHAQHAILNGTGLREHQFRVCMLERAPELVPLANPMMTGALRCVKKMMTIMAFLKIQNKSYALICGHGVQLEDKVEHRLVSNSNEIMWETFGKVIFLKTDFWKPVPIDVALVEMDDQVGNRLKFSDSHIISVFSQDFHSLVGRHVKKTGITTGRTVGIVQSDFCRVPRSSLRPSADPYSKEMETLRSVLVVGDPGFASKGDSGSLVTLKSENDLAVGYLHGKLVLKLVPVEHCPTKVTKYVVFPLKPALREISRNFNMHDIELFSTNVLLEPKGSFDHDLDSGVFSETWVKS